MACKRRHRLVPGNDTGANRHRSVAIRYRQFAVGVEDFGFEVVRQLGVFDQFPNLGGATGKFRQILDFDPLEDAADRRFQLVGCEVAAIGVPGGGKTVWDLDPEDGQFLVHLTEGGVLATDGLGVGQSEVREPFDKRHRCASTGASLSM